MSVRKRKVNGQWVDIGSEVLKTDITIKDVDIPSVILPGDDVLLISEKMIYSNEEENPASTVYNATGIYITIPKTGIYKFKTSGSICDNTGTDYKIKIMNVTTGIQLGDEQSLDDDGGAVDVIANNINCSENDIIEVYVQGSRSTLSSIREGYAGALIAYIDSGNAQISNHVKRKNNERWENFSTMPLKVPINRENWEIKKFSTGKAPWDDDLKNDYGTVGTIIIPKDGNYTFKWGSYGDEDHRAQYQLKKENTTLSSGTATTYVNNYSYTDNFSQGDKITLTYKCGKNVTTIYTSYAIGYCSPLVAFYND